MRPKLLRLSIALGLLVAFAGLMRALDQSAPEREPEPVVPLRTDLLRKIDPGKDSVSGKWRIENGALVSPPDQGARLQLPHQPPAEYDLHLTVERLEGTGSLNVGLATPSNQFMAVLDAVKDAGWCSGLHWVDGKSVHANPTTREGRLLAERRRHSLDCRVRRGSVEILLDREIIARFVGDAERLSMEPFWKVPDSRALFIAGWEGVFRISDLSLTTTGDPGRSLR